MKSELLTQANNTPKPSHPLEKEKRASKQATPQSKQELFTQAPSETTQKAPGTELPEQNESPPEGESHNHTETDPDRAEPHTPPREERHAETDPDPTETHTQTREESPQPSNDEPESEAPPQTFAPGDLSPWTQHSMPPQPRHIGPFIE